MAIVESVWTGVVASYIYGVLASSAPERLKKLAPALFFGGPTPLAEAEKAFQEAKATLLQRYKGEVAVERFLADRNLRNGVLDPLFANIFLSRQLVTSELDHRFWDCFDNAAAARSKASRLVVDDIISEVRRSLLGRSATAPFVIESSLREIKSSLEAITKISSAYLPTPDYKGDAASELDRYVRYYLTEIKEYIKTIFINGLEMISKKERIAHPIGESYVPILVEALSSSTGRELGVHSRIDAFEVVKDARRLIVRGPAGCGKTTLMQWLIWNADPFDAASSAYRHRMFPIYVPLRRLESAGTFNFTADSILYSSMPNDILKRDFPKDWLNGLIGAGLDVILLIDGIDEIAEKNRGHIWRLVRALSDKHPSLRILITSRHISTVHLSDGSYRPEIFLNEEAYQEARVLWNRPDDFFEFVVCPLSNGDIVDLIDKWFNGVDPLLVSRAERDKLPGYPEQLKKALFDKTNAISLELARTPLLSSLICLVFFLQRGSLPKNRKQLYELSTQLLVETRDEHKGVRPDERFSNFDLDKRLRMLRAVALIMQEGSQSIQADQSIEVEKSKVVSWIQRQLKDQTTLPLEAKEYLNFLVERSSLIREPSANRIDFVHRSFMEYLAGEEIVSSKDAFQIRDKILLDEWWNTLTFCMSTTAGGAYFGSILLREILDYVFESDLKRRRKFLVKALSLLHYLNDPIPATRESIKRAASEVLPPLNDTESDDLAAIPVGILEELISYKVVGTTYSQEQLEKCVDLLCAHDDEEVRKIFLTGYTDLDSRDIIRKINQTGRVSVSEHSALFRRLQNRSYTDPVYLTSDNLRDRDLRSGLLNSVWLKMPVIGDVFVGWDFLQYVRDVRLLNPKQSDFEIMRDSIKKRRFQNCKALSIVFGHGFDFNLISELFPELESIAIERSSGVHLDGLERMSTVKEIWFENCSQSVFIEDRFIPASLKDIVFYRSVNPIIKSAPMWLNVHNEKLSRDNILIQ